MRAAPHLLDPGRSHPARSRVPARSRAPRALRCALLVLALVPALAQAQAQAPAERERAIRAAKQATTLYKAGQHAEAAELFLEAHRLTGLPVQLRNAAKALEESGATARAIESWRALLALPASSEEERAEAREHLARLEPPAVVAPPPPRADPTPDIDAAPVTSSPASQTAILETSPPPARTEWPAFVLMGGGGAAVAGGTILWIVSASALGTLDERLATTEGGRISGIGAAEAQQDLDAINQQRAIGTVLLGVGAAALVTGALWAFDVL